MSEQQIVSLRVCVCVLQTQTIGASACVSRSWLWLLSRVRMLESTKGLRNVGARVGSCSGIIVGRCRLCLGFSVCICVMCICICGKTRCISAIRGFFLASSPLNLGQCGICGVDQTLVRCRGRLHVVFNEICCAYISRELQAPLRLFE